MRRRIVLAALVAAAGFSASPSLADGKADSMAACLGASNNNTELCTCKTDEAVKIADEEMLGFIAIALKDNPKFREMVQKGEVPDAVIKKWPVYVRQSNAVCIPPAN